MTTPAGWYPDPHGATALRYWDGTQWTEHTAPGVGGVAASSTRPVEVAPQPALPDPPATAPAHIPQPVAPVHSAALGTTQPSSTPASDATAVTALILSALGLGVIGAPLGLESTRKAVLGRPAKPGMGTAAVWVAVVVALIQSIALSPLGSLIILFNSNASWDDGPAYFMASMVGGLVVLPLIAIAAAISIPVQLSRIKKASVAQGGIADSSRMGQARAAGITYLVITVLGGGLGLLVWLLALGSLFGEINAAG